MYISKESKEGVVVDIKKKILKVKGLNDYIFNVNEPMINFSYFVECVKLNKVPEYLIIDNPFIEEENKEYNENKENEDDNNKENEEENNTETINRSISKNIVKRRNKLENIAFYEKTNDNIMKEIYVKTDLKKKVIRRKGKRREVYWKK